MRILQINCVYKQGSTGKIVECISRDLIDQGHDVLTCYGEGDAHYDNHSIKVCTANEHNFNALWGRITGVPFGGIYLSNYRIKKTIKKYHPDIVHVHCVNGYMVNVYRLLKYLAEKRIKTVITLHAEIFHTAGCEHAYECEKWKTQCRECKVYRKAVGSFFFERSEDSWKRMYDAVNGFNVEDLVVTAVSPWLAGRAKQSTIMKRYNVISVLNGLDTSIFYYHENKGLIERQGYKKVILFVTPYFGLEDDDIKGGRYILALSKALSEYKFLVVASRVAHNVIELPGNVQLWGRAKTQYELAQLYSEADVTLLLSRRETFSMVTAESLCCGTPVVGFKAGGPDSIAIKAFTEFVEYGDIDTLITILIRRSLSNSYEKASLSRVSAERFDSKQMSIGYSRVYKDLICK